MRLLGGRGDEGEKEALELRHRGGAGATASRRRWSCKSRRLRTTRQKGKVLTLDPLCGGQDICSSRASRQADVARWTRTTDMDMDMGTGTGMGTKGMGMGRGSRAATARTTTTQAGSAAQSTRCTA